MNKNRSSRWLYGTAWIALGIVAVSGCSGRVDRGDDAPGGTWLDNTGLMHPDGTMRPAMAWLMDFLGRGK
ncbi:hypothetical protein WME73_28615 [Sorangium sp. So ce302]|uniref:hypothetical protein n=1 Tax=unclassified Sorangium TaxID=2621164 RepID=UPI003F5E2369